MGLVRRFLPRPDPGLRRRRRSTSSTCATSPPATCSPTRRARSASATSSAGATSPSTACSPTSPGSRASPPPALKLPASVALAGARRPPRARAAAADRSPTRSRSASLWWTYRNTKATQRARLRAPPARGDAARTRSRGSATELGGPSRRRRSPRRLRPARAGRLRRGSAHGERDEARPLPLPDADQRPLPLRRGRAAAAQARARAPRPSGCPTGAGPARDRGADPPAARPGAGRRRRGDPRLEADPRSTWSGNTPSREARDSTNDGRAVL